MTAGTNARPVRKLLLIEPEAGGHHFIPYLQFFVRALLESKVQLRLLSSRSATGHPAWHILQSEFGDSLPMSWMDELPPVSSGTVALMAGQWRYWGMVARGFAALPKQLRPDHVFVMSLDGLDRAIAVRGSPFGNTPYSGLLVHLKLHWPALKIGPAGRFARIQGWLFNRMLRQPTCYAIATIDEFFTPYWAPKHPKYAKKLRYVPDPGELHAINKMAARSTLGLAANAQVVLVYGSLSCRKGVAELLRATALSKRKIVALLAGAADREIRDLLSSPDVKARVASGDVYVIDAYLDPGQEQQVFSAADVVWLGYARDFYGQSAVLAQAASADRPVLSRIGGLIGQTTQAHQLGLCVDPNDRFAVLAALESLQTNPSLLQGFSVGAAQFAPKRRAVAYGAAMLNCLPVTHTAQ